MHGDPQPINFFDDASTDDGESALMGTAEATPESRHVKNRHSADSQTVPLHLSTPLDRGMKYAPPRPPRPPGTLDPSDFQITPEIKMVRKADWSGSPRRYSVPLDTVGHGRSASSTKEDILSVHAITLEAILRSKSEPHTARTRTAEAHRAGAAAATTAKPNRISIALPPTPLDLATADAPPPRIKQTLARSAAPYPIGIRKSFRQSHVSFNGDAAPPPREAILALTLRRRPGRRSARVGEVRIPASLDVVVEVPATPPPEAATAAPSKDAGATSAGARGGSATGTATDAPSPPRETKKRSERHFETLDFDDAYLFRALRGGYARLAGPLRFLSARGLRAIEVTHSGPSSPAASSSSPCCCRGGGGGGEEAAAACPHRLPRSPARLVASGLADPCSERDLLAGFRAGAGGGRAQYMWVHWAHRLASVPPHLAPAASPPAPVAVRGVVALGDHVAEKAEEDGGGTVGGKTDHDAPPGPPAAPAMPSCVAGLEFVEGWAAGRVSLAVLLVAALAVVAALLWIFEGFSPALLDAGFRGAAERVTGGCLVGLFVMLLGLTVVGLWAFVSWLAD
jgi:hypothetical protein